ncbi:MAG: hypothetical protein HYX24_06600 [Candidatus Aenigmarchaeota archaeon]|nr:hypothetical protein [Candidatus Aenigmarchaeota archaeon]
MAAKAAGKMTPYDSLKRLMYGLLFLLLAFFLRETVKVNSLPPFWLVLPFASLFAGFVAIGESCMRKCVIEKPAGKKSIYLYILSLLASAFVFYFLLLP